MIKTIPSDKNATTIATTEYIISFFAFATDVSLPSENKNKYAEYKIKTAAKAINSPKKKPCILDIIIKRLGLNKGDMHFMPKISLHGFAGWGPKTRADIG